VTCYIVCNNLSGGVSSDSLRFFIFSQLCVLYIDEFVSELFFGENNVASSSSSSSSSSSRSSSSSNSQFYALVNSNVKRLKKSLG